MDRDTIRALTLNKNSQSISFTDIPQPYPESGQVLIKVHVTPINSMDIDSISKSNPNSFSSQILGIEGSGIIYQEHKSIFSKKNKGKKVSFMQLNSSLPGAWAEYVVCDEKYFMVLNDNIDYIRGCSLMINPLTILMMNEKIKAKKHKSIIHTNAATDLGVQFIKWCHFNDYTSIHIVKSESDLLKLVGVAEENVLVLESAQFQENLENLMSKLTPTIAFDSIGGSLPGQIFNLMPENSELYLYGNSADCPLEGLNPTSFIFSGKSVKGLWFKKWFDELGALKRYKYYKKIQKVHFVFTSSVSSLYPITQYDEAIREYSPLGMILLHFACDLYNSSQYLTEELLSQYIGEDLKNKVSSLPDLVFDTPDLPLKVITEGIYKGRLVDNKPNGPGILLNKGSYYIGNFTDGQKEGFGRLVTDDHWYEGNFAKGAYNGLGRFTIFEGHMIQGTFADGKLNGMGFEKLPSGEVYRGEFINSLRHGHGEIEYENIKFTGEFHQGLAEGPGSVVLEDSSVFEGNYHNGIGTGKLMMADGRVVEGTIVGNKFTEDLKENTKNKGN